MKKLLVLFSYLMIVATMFAQNNNYQNPKNPYDDVGQKHNTGVIALTNKINKLKLNSFVKVIDEYTKDSSDFKQIGDRLKTQSNTLALNIIKLSREGQGFMKSLAVCINNSTSTIDLSSCFILIENDVMNSKTIKVNEKQILLMAASVGRYSAFHWSNNTPSMKINWSKIKDIIKADFDGAVDGASAGSNFPPYGAVIGAVGGAIIGSCCAVSSIPTSGGPIKKAVKAELPINN